MLTWDAFNACETVLLSTCDLAIEYCQGCALTLESALLSPDKKADFRDLQAIFTEMTLATTESCVFDLLVEPELRHLFVLVNRNAPDRLLPVSFTQKGAVVLSYMTVLEHLVTLQKMLLEQIGEWDISAVPELVHDYNSAQQLFEHTKGVLGSEFAAVRHFLMTEYKHLINDAKADSIPDSAKSGKIKPPNHVIMYVKYCEDKKLNVGKHSAAEFLDKNDLNIEPNSLRDMTKRYLRKGWKP